MKRILFITSAGYATDILVERFLDAAKIAGVDVHVEVVAEENGLARFKEGDYDMLLLGSILRHLINDKGDKAFPKKAPIFVVESSTYGKMDGAELFSEISKNWIVATH